MRLGGPATSRGWALPGPLPRYGEVAGVPYTLAALPAKQVKEGRCVRVYNLEATILSVPLSAGWWGTGRCCSGLPVAWPSCCTRQAPLLHHLHFQGLPL